jgi:transcriptional regulator with XRE-family HTH domain
MTKAIERGVARALRAEHATPVKELARLLGVSAGSISLWVRDIDIHPEQRRRNMSRAGKVRGDTWRELNRERRRLYQEEGRRRARLKTSRRTSPGACSIGRREARAAIPLF